MGRSGKLLFIFTLALLFPLACLADYGIGSYFLTGTIFSSDGRPLRNKEVVMSNSSASCASALFMTDNEGKFNIEVSYFIPCPSRTPGSRSILDEARLENNDSLRFHFKSQFGACANSWLKYFTNKTCSRSFFDGPITDKNCLTIKCDIHLTQSANSAVTETVDIPYLGYLKKHLDTICMVKLDSLQQLKVILEAEKAYDKAPKYHRTRGYNDSSAIDYVIAYPIAKHLHKLKLELENAGNLVCFFLEGYQLTNRNIADIKKLPQLCSSIFNWQSDNSRLQYVLSSYFIPHLKVVVKTDASGKIIEAYQDYK